MNERPLLESGKGGLNVHLWVDAVGAKQKLSWVPLVGRCAPSLSSGD